MIKSNHWITCSLSATMKKHGIFELFLGNDKGTKEGTNGLGFLVDVRSPKDWGKVETLFSDLFSRRGMPERLGPPVFFLVSRTLKRINQNT